MAVSDFIYDNIYLSEFNSGKYVMGYFSADEQPTQGDMNINQVSLFGGKEQPFVYTNYESTLTFTIGIIKNPCVTSETDISIAEMENLKRWLCRPAPHIFKLNDSDYNGIYWEGTFKVEEQIVGNKRVGVILSFISTRPYALQDDVVYTGTVAANGKVTINDVSKEIGYIYPDITLTVLTDGNLTIYNDFDQRQTIIKNCEADEVIIFSKYQQISTDSATHDLFNDFNYKFIRIGNNYATTENKLSFSLSCRYVITYNPIRKVLPI